MDRIYDTSERKYKTNMKWWIDDKQNLSFKSILGSNKTQPCRWGIMVKNCIASMLFCRDITKTKFH